MRNYILIVFQQARFQFTTKDPQPNKFTCTAKFRYRQPDTEVDVEILEDDKVKVVYKNPVRAVTPGQAVVFL